MPQVIIHPDLAKHTISPESTKAMIYGFIAGYREVDVETEVTTGLGRKKNKIEKRIIVSEDTALGNEDAADYIWKVVSALMDAATAASNYDSDEVYDQFRGKIRNELPETLRKKILYEGNPFNMKISSIPEITTTLAELYLPAKKGVKGWWYDKTSGSPQNAPNVSISSDGNRIEARVREKQGFFSNLWPGNK
jgi:hypothetical protein